MPGHRLDRYELLALVAEGGMGQVWLARLVGKHGFEKLVAVKTLLPKFAADPKFQQMFLDEARIASGIEHSNVAHILDLGEQNDVLYLVMELVDGEALSKLTRVLGKANIDFPIEIGLRIIADTCAGIHAAHELRGPDGREIGIVHRDISPQNILITTTGVAKLIDFGIAKARDRFAGETGEGILKGKIHYMSTEQALGQKIDRRADIFSLGAILYYLFSGKPAYDGESQLATLHMLTSGRPPLPLPARVPRAVGDVVKKALAFLPADRFQTALEMQRAITKAMSEAGLAADTGDVAAFAATHLAERWQKRRNAIDLALKAASERASMNAALLLPASSKSSPGTAIPFGGMTPASEVSAVPKPSEPARAGSVSEVEAVALRTAIEARETPVVASAERKRTTRIALIAVNAIVVIVLIVFVATRGTKSDKESTATQPPAATSAPVAQLPATETTSVLAASPPSTSSIPVESASTTASSVAPAIGTKATATVRGPRGDASTPRGTASAKPTNVPDFGY